MTMGRMHLLAASGTPSDVGAVHGSTFADEIAAYARDRSALSAEGTDLSPDGVLDIAASMLDAHRDYDPALFAEMVAMADAAGITPAEAVIVGGYTDFIDAVRAVAGSTACEDDCTAFIIPDASADGAGFLAQTWDMHASATPHVFMFDVAIAGDPRSLVFTTHGTVGQIGMNEAGIAVGINNLTVEDGSIGVTWPFVVRKALRQTTLDAAIDCVLDAQLAGGHSFLLFDSEGQGAMIEATPTTTHVTHLDGSPLVHTNHCLVPDTLPVETERPDDLVASSIDRLSQASERLSRGPIDEVAIERILSDERSICRHPDPVFGYETSGAAIMRPATSEFWACWGRPSEHPFERFTVA